MKTGTPHANMPGGSHACMRPNAHARPSMRHPCKRHPCGRAPPPDGANQLVVAAVHAAVRQEPDEVHGVVGKGLADQLPARALKHLARGQRQVDQTRALVHDLPRAERVVAHLAVAHVGVAGKADGCAMRLDGAVAVGHGAQRVGGGGLRGEHGVELVLHVDAPAVQDAHHHRAIGLGDGGVWIELEGVGCHVDAVRSELVPQRGAGVRRWDQAVAGAGVGACT